jgi:NadR type nicotinamide-nucleotide adenylyltransferase
VDIKRISITGPESTGKSMLAEQLATQFKTVFVPEYAREYLDNLGREYLFEDIAVIAGRQLELEDQLAVKADRLLFCDTDMLVTKVWSEFRYGRCDAFILDRARDHIYDLYLLCNIDLPWVFDPLREHPEQREELFRIYKTELEQMKVNYKVISGTGEDRLKEAILAVEEAFYKSPVR